MVNSFVLNPFLLFADFLSFSVVAISPKLILQMHAHAQIFIKNLLMFFRLCCQRTSKRLLAHFALRAAWPTEPAAVSLLQDAMELPSTNSLRASHEYNNNASIATNSEVRTERVKFGRFQSQTLTRL